MKSNNVNLLLLAVTVLSLLLAAYGLFFAPRDFGRAAPSRDAACSHPCAAANSPIDSARQDRATSPVDQLPRNGRADTVGGGTSATGGAGDERATGGAHHKPSDGSTPQAAPATDTSGEISGVVLDSHGRAVESASVVARPADLRDSTFQSADFERDLAEREQYIQRMRAQQRSAGTGADGRFVLRGLNAAQAYDISASSPAGGVARVNRVACGDSITLLLSRECVLRGRVTRADGAPLTRFRIHWLRADMPGDPASDSVVSIDGRFEVRVRPGRHSVWVSVAGVEDSPRQELDVPEAGAEANFTFNGLAALAGTVKDAQGNALPDATVRLAALDQESRGDEEEMERGGIPSTRTDSLGRYRFEALSPGRYSARAAIGERSEAREFALSAGDNTQNFTLNAGARVTLRFRRASGEAVTEVNVVFERRGRTVRATALPAQEPGVRVYIGLEPGDYSIRYFARGGAWARHEAKLADGDNQLSLEIAEAAFVQGIVSGAGTPEGLLLRLRPESGKAEQNSHHAAQVASDGAFRVGPVLPGDYVLELLAQRRTVVFTTRVKLSVGDNTHDLAVRDLAGVQLRVTLPDGKPAAGARVTLASGKNNFSARCDERGLARLSYIPAGECTLWAEAGAMRTPVVTTHLRSGESEVTLELKAPNCVRVSRVDKGSDAEAAGILVNDLIFIYNGRDVSDRRTLDALIRESRGQDSVNLSVERGGRVMVLNIKGGGFGGVYADAVR